jgi:hypothetical protein
METPAMASGLRNNVWTIRELIEESLETAIEKGTAFVV